MSPRAVGERGEGFTGAGGQQQGAMGGCTWWVNAPFMRFYTTDFQKQKDFLKKIDGGVVVLHQQRSLRIILLVK